MTLSYETLTFGTWNVRSLKEKKTEVVAEVERENQDVVVLTETKLRGSGQEILSGYVHLYSGVSTGPSRAGVSVLIKEHLRRNLRWEATSERIIQVKLKICGRRIIVLGVYWVDECASSCVKDQYVSALSEVLQSLGDSDDVIILGDFNARVGRETKTSAVGEHGEGDANNNGRRLVSLCDQFHLKIQNTFFEHLDIHKYTWYHPKSTSRSMIDYCITRQSSGIVVRDVIACRWLQCRTDHIYLEATFLLPVCENVTMENRSTEKSCFPERKIYKTYLLYSKTERNRYKDYLDFSLGAWERESIGAMYEKLKNAIHSAAHAVLRVYEKETSGEFLWDSELIHIRKQWQYSKKNEPSKIYEVKDTVNGTSEKTDQEMATVKNEIWEGICTYLERKPKYHRNRIALCILKQFLYKSDQKLYQHDKYKIETFYETLFSEKRKLYALNAEVFSTKLHNSECSAPPISVTVSEVTNALNCLDDINKYSPGGLTVQLLKFSSCKTRQLLADIIQKIFNSSGKDIPSEINRTYLYINDAGKKQPLSANTVTPISNPILRVIDVLLNKTFEKFLKNEFSIPHEPCKDVMFILRLLLQKSATKQNKNPQMAFLDIDIFFEDVPHQELFAMLRKLDIHKMLLEVAFNVVGSGTFECFLDSDEYTKPFPIGKGLRRGSILSRTLLKLYICDILSEWGTENSGRGFWIQNCSLFSFLCDDSLVMISDSVSTLEIILQSLKRRLRLKGLHLSKKNIRYLGDGTLKLGRGSIVGETSIEFHGSILELNGRSESDIYSKVLQTKRIIGYLHPVARDSFVTKKNKIRIFNSIVRCFLTDGCETWTILDDCRRKLEFIEMSYWQWCCETEKLVSLAQMHDAMGIRHSIFRITMLNKCAWFANMQNMVPDSWPRRILAWEPEGKSKVSRPRKKWEDGIQEFMLSMNVDYMSHCMRK